MRDGRRSIDKFFICACYGEGLRVTHWIDDGDVHLSMWKYRSWHSTCWRQRLRHIWNIIRYGEPWTDEVTFTKEEARDVGEYLLSISEKVHP